LKHLHTDMQEYERKNRLAKYILQIENDGCFQAKHTETAEYVGGSYRHLLYTLNQFHEEGLLEKKGRGYY
ncbi:helix-turn-helix domain-containing protein, partial [Peribacillus frigoritolerans]|uniref:helix-turn-helix domain-containing protein n=1 Tax=Peribacillus frigoritolerans TaxID=450367 RepID=UPI00201C19EA